MDQDLERLLARVDARRQQLAAGCPSMDGVRAIALRALEDVVRGLELLAREGEALAARADVLAAERAAIEDERRRYRDLCWDAPEAYLATDRVGIIHDANRAAGELLRRAPAALRGRALPHLVVTADRRALIELLVGAGRDGATPSRRLRLRPAGRPELPCEVAVARIAELGASAELRWSLTELVAADAGQRERRDDDHEFAALVHDQLVDPGSPLARTIDAVAAQVLAPMALADQPAARDRDLVADLLDATQVWHGDVELARERISVAAVIQRGLAVVEATARVRGQTIAFAPAPGELHVIGDRGRLEQVLVNLLDNASKFSPPGSVIEVEERRQGDRVVVAVRDRGRGITPEQMPGIFDPWRRPADDRSTAPAGLGIGLALAARLVTRHGGTLEARSGGPARGAELRVGLPLAPTTVRPARRSAG